MTDPAELEREREAIEALGVRLGPRDASAIARRPRPEAAAHARRPLGLAPVPGDTGEPERTEAGGSFLDGVGRERLDMPATMEMVYAALDGAASMTEGVHQKASEGLARLRGEIAELKLALTEARCEVREMRAIQEQARIASRGEAGSWGRAAFRDRQARQVSAAKGGMQGHARRGLCSMSPAIRRRSFRPTALRPPAWRSVRFLKNSPRRSRQRTRPLNLLLAGRTLLAESGFDHPGVSGELALEHSRMDVRPVLAPSIRAFQVFCRSAHLPEPYGGRARSPGGGRQVRRGRSAAC